MLREIKKLAGPEAAKNEKPAVAKRPAAREGQVGPTPPTRREPDAADREMDRWEKEIDERKRRWVEAGGDGDPEDANEHEDVPPSSRRIG